MIASPLPDFTFPVIALAPDTAAVDPRDSGIRAFNSVHELTRTFMPMVDTRLGWTFVDLQGRCWEATSSKVVGRAEHWPKSLLPSFFYDPQYRLVHAFAEQSPMSFDAVKSRLFAKVKANPQFWGADAGWKFQELREAESLRDLVKTDAELAAEREAGAIERLKPEPLWWQWLSWEGRCSRRGFVAAMALIAGWMLIAWRTTMPTIVIMFIVALILWVSAIVRRLHDLRLSGWWVVPWWLWVQFCLSGYKFAPQWGQSALFWSGWLSTAGLFGCLCLWPGTRGPNRYGFSREGPAAVRTA